MAKASRGPMGQVILHPERIKKGDEVLPPESTILTFLTCQGEYSRDLDGRSFLL